MLAADILNEFRTAWMPNASTSGLKRLVELLSTSSPYLVHGTFSKACGIGCLATHIAWHHPETMNLSDEAGVVWLTKVARLNPATSWVIVAWDRTQPWERDLRVAIRQLCEAELERRMQHAGPRWLRSATLPELNTLQAD